MSSLHSALKEIRPRPFAYHFNALLKIPRPSGHEKHVREYLMAWAKSFSYPARTDQKGNVAIDIPGSSKAAEQKTLLLQAHMDMVAVKAKGSDHDFLTDPIEIEREGDFIYSKGHQTSLGADNGMGICMALALAEDQTYAHPPLTLLFTVDEEMGLKGARALGHNLVPRDLLGLINLDAEKGPAAICYGSAAGSVTRATWRYEDLQQNQDSAPKGKTWQISLSGLRGGHSGIDIGKGRGSALLLLIEWLVALPKKMSYQLLLLQGGQQLNAIPKEAEAILIVSSADELLLEGALKEWKTALKKQLGQTNVAGIKITIRTLKTKRPVLKKGWLASLKSLPVGVLKKEEEDVTISNNLGVIRFEKKEVLLIAYSRYAIFEEKAHHAIEKQIKAILQKSGAKVTQDRHTGWQESSDSLLVKKALAISRKQGHQPKAFSYHAGLELSPIRERLTALGYQTADLSCIAIGPHVFDAHSTEEHFALSSILPTYRLLRGILQELS